MGTVWTTLHSFCTQNFILFKFSFDTCVFMARLHNMPCRIHPCLSYFDFRQGNCLSHKTSGKTWNFMYKTYGELSTTCHHFEYRPLVIAKFQRAVTSLFFTWFCSNFHWLFSIMNSLNKSKLDMWVLVSFKCFKKAKICKWPDIPCLLISPHRLLC